MMLASPLLPAAPEDPLSFRPARDVDAFNSLLPPPIEFVEGSSSGALAVPEGKYQPINVSPKLSTKDRPDTLSVQSRSPTSPAVAPTPLSPLSAASPLSTKRAAVQPSTLGLDISWPETCDRASGLFNTGNTCFLNSALQCLLHTPPLLRVTIAHGRDKCRASDKFCMICVFRQVVVQAHKSSSPFAPSPVTNRLQTIAKHMRRGRQEDSHEFLRYAIDAMQKSCLNGAPPKLEAKLAETTWVHKIFGGKLRSRVSCKSCGHNSDTFDRILDLSLDILKADSLKEALREFVAPDYLKGADKYKCEKCKKHVNAEKRFTVHEAPTVLTVHFKRFSPLGRKIGHHVTYDETLSLQPYMSKDQFGPMYSLYGIICHAGGGPNSGHYYAYVKSRTGRWHEMNDEVVTPISGAPVNKKMAYVLFYLRNKGQGLQAALRASANGMGSVDGDKEKKGDRVSLVAGMKKRREREGEDNDEEDVGEKVDSSPSKFIGPLLPSPMEKSEGTPDAKRFKGEHTADAENKVDPQAEKIKQKIQAVQEDKAQKVLALLEKYDSSSSGDEEARTGKEKGKVKAKGRKDGDDKAEGSSLIRHHSSPPSGSTKSGVASSPVSSADFYGQTKSFVRANGTIPPSSPVSSASSTESESDNEDRKRKTQSSSSLLIKAKTKKLEKAKMRMSMEPRSKGYVNPYSRVGSENALRSGGFGMNSANGGGGRMHTYGKRKQWRPRGL